MAERYDAIVIGSGLGGLTAGALYAHAGKRVLLLERNATFGGAATTYRHGAMTVEGSLHETPDPRQTLDPKGAVFEALDLYDDVEFVRAPDIYEVRSPVLGAPFVLPFGFEAIQAAVTTRFPDHEANIERFLRHLRRAGRALDYMGGGHSALWRITHAADLPLELWAVVRDFRSTLSEVLERFFCDDEAIKIALAANVHYYTDDPDELWWLVFALSQGGYLEAGGSFIKGGSQRLSDRLVKAIVDEGGEAESEREVIGIELDDAGRASGVRYCTETSGHSVVAEAPVIFANAAPHAVGEMLPEEVRQEFMGPYRDKPLSISLAYAAFGLKRPPSELGMTSYSTNLLPNWVRKLSDYKSSADVLADAPGDRMPVLAIVDYNRIDSGIRGNGLYPVSADCLDQISNWEDLDPEAYEARKSAWLSAIRTCLDQEWPGFADAVAESTFATARSMREHLNTPDGALYGFAPPTRGTMEAPVQVATSVPGLWLASAFSGGGGYPGAMNGGASAARAALKEET
ncbi:MAG: NAD(P)/FAD-dependent oxidoreductase [Pseudomonadota bacterium]